MSKIWIDVINPSHALFFNAILNDLIVNDKIITVRDRAETLDLIRSFGIEGAVIGTDYRDPLKKTANMVLRTLELAVKVPNFDCAISFENGMSVMTAKYRGKKSLLFCDNDLKFLQRKSSFQDLETKVKSMADYIIVPDACSTVFKKHINANKIITYDGYKEDIYIADYKPDPNFKDKIPFEDFVVVRPEALGSFYVKENRSIVPDILDLFNENNINVIFLPREKEDLALLGDHDVFMPKKALNGLDLCYYSSAVMTGSGTLAREAACMGIPSVSFFPGNNLLSVDLQLVGEGKILHSRNPEEILAHILENSKREKNVDFSRSKKAKSQFIKIVNNLLS